MGIQFTNKIHYRIRTMRHRINGMEEKEILEIVHIGDDNVIIKEATCCSLWWFLLSFQSIQPHFFVQIASLLTSILWMEPLLRLLLRLPLRLQLLLFPFIHRLRLLFVLSIKWYFTLVYISWIVNIFLWPNSVSYRRDWWYSLHANDEFNSTQNKNK